MRALALSAILAVLAGPAWANPTPQAIETATFQGGDMPLGRSALTVKAQVLLDRAGISPGVIDGFKGGMTRAALMAFEAREGFAIDGQMDAQVWRALVSGIRSPITEVYRISAEDMAIQPDMPADMMQRATFDRLGFQRVSEALAEKFHMDEDLLTRMNPDAEFVEGERIMVVYPGEYLDTTVTRLRVDAAAGRVDAMNAEGIVIASYPAGVRSDAFTEAGMFEISDVRAEPTYALRPQGGAEEAVLPPGENNPVGLVWIGLGDLGHGIHGTDDPALLGRGATRGAVHMTNWDALELSRMVGTGAAVEVVR